MTTHGTEALVSAPTESGARIVPGAGLDWNSTSRDYLAHRPGYPESFFRLLGQVGVGLPGQHILDLGTGTGALAIPFARAGAHVAGVDASEAQLVAAREAATREGLTIDLRFARAEESGLSSGSFDAITASMCWGYFDTARMVEEVPRLLRRDGVLVIASILWVRGSSEVTRATDELIARYNDAAGTNPRGRPTDPIPAWSRERFELRTYHTYVEPLVFSRESWRGRIRASKWLGAALPADRVAAFDRELDDALRRLGGEPFPIPHRITLQVFEPLRPA